MTPDIILDIFKHAIFTTTIIVMILVLPGLIVGLLVAIFQAATQINEMSMSFVPKVLVTFLALTVTGPWVLNLLLGFTENLITNAMHLIG